MKVGGRVSEGRMVGRNEREVVENDDIRANTLGKDPKRRSE